MANEVAQVDKNMIPEQGITIHDIIIRPVQRHSQDIDNWRNALKAAEMINDVRWLLYDLYEEIILDARLKKLIGKRVLGVTKNRLVYVNADGSEDEAIGKLLKSKQGRYLRKEIQLQKAWGISVIELGIVNNALKVYSVARKHIRPKKGIITLEQSGFEGYNYREPPYNRVVLEVGRYDDLGYILEACPYVIYKRGGFGDWAQFGQIFGMPFREARYDGYNDGVRKQLIEALEQAGSASYVVLPKEAEFTYHEAKNAQGNSELFDMLRKACNEEMAVLILGQEATTVQQAGKLGNDDTQDKTEDDINLDDREDEISIFNEDVKPILINIGFKLDPNGQFMHKPGEEKIKAADFVSMAVKAKTQLQLPIDDDQIYQVTGLNKPSDYNNQKEQLQQETSSPDNEQTGDNQQPSKKPASKQQPGKQKNLTAWYKLRQSLADFFDPPR